MLSQNFKSVTVKAPGSSANLGPGFDCLGMAWDLYNVLRFTLTEEEGVSFSGCDALYENENNLALRGFRAAIEFSGRKELKKCGLRIDFLRSEIPAARGLGSSASLTAAGVFAADKLFSLNFKEKDLLFITALVEGHPDNAAPALFGGLTASVMEEGKAAFARFPVNDAFFFTALVPDFELSTKLARSVLPKNISMGDAVSNLACTVLLLKALENGDAELLKTALRDRLHQEYRAKLIPGFEEIKKAAGSAGAPFICISGSGPALLAISFEQTAPALKEALRPFPSWRVLPLKKGEGVKIIY